MEENIYFYAGGNSIEGLLRRGRQESGVIITHPHPLYGGDMHNNVVTTITRAYRTAGWTTLRFNFRGVGGSQGSYDQGRGEQRDVAAAITFLAGLGIGRVDLAGYSFGAWVNALLQAESPPVGNMIMVSPPLAFLDFTPIGELDRLRLVITGSHDEIAPADLIRKSISRWNAAARLEVIEGADHFYGGYQDQLAAVLADYLK
ncbi:MAG: alpha/beta fold hydrolase [Smithellaceae bacterium]|nr:alpha/beta fold hydrolase [Smithellaceae bacterium]